MPSNRTDEWSADEEAKVVELVKAGDYDAVETLYLRYNRQAFGLARRLLNNPEAAEDAVQEAFLKFWKHPDSYNPARGRFLTWLLSVVHNLSIDVLRKQRAMMVSLDQPEISEQLNFLADESLPLEDEVWLGLQRTVVRDALGTLPGEQRNLIELAFFRGLTHTEIAHATGQPLGTVKSRIRQGLLKLKGIVASLA